MKFCSTLMIFDALSDELTRPSVWLNKQRVILHRKTSLRRCPWNACPQIPLNSYHAECGRIRANLLSTVPMGYQVTDSLGIDYGMLIDDFPSLHMQHHFNMFVLFQQFY